jgi:hypothetical protein
VTAPALVGRLLVEDTDPCARCGVQLGVHPERKPAHVAGQIVGSDWCAWLVYAEVHRLCVECKRPLATGCAHMRAITGAVDAARTYHFGGTK